MIEVILDLLQKAVEQPHFYYHLLSGVDLPIKNNRYIYDFFEGARDKEFLSFDNKIPNDIVYRDRYSYRYYFHHDRKNLLLKGANKLMINFQKLFKIKRKFYFNKFYKGAVWFSLTESFIKYVISNRNVIEKQFKYSFCADEIFMQTLIMNSPFKKNLIDSAFENSTLSNLREIDWKRGNPYVWRTRDEYFLKKSKCLFARKFDIYIDKKIVNDVYATLVQHN